jgi:site-specific recombinase XerD
MVERAGAEANLDIKVHAHMLRHATGFKLANDKHDSRAIQAYMGHKNIQNTARYAALASGEAAALMPRLSQYLRTCP